MAQLAAVLGMLSAKGGHERWQHILPRHGGCPQQKRQGGKPPGISCGVRQGLTLGQYLFSQRI